MSRTSYSVDLIKQMAVCDANYIRLLKLAETHAQYQTDPSRRQYIDRVAEQALRGDQARWARYSALKQDKASRRVFRDKLRQPPRGYGR